MTRTKRSAPGGGSTATLTSSSSVCLRPEINIFPDLPMQSEIAYQRIDKCPTLSSLPITGENSVLHWRFLCDEGEMIDPSKINLSLYFDVWQIVDGKDVPLPAAVVSTARGKSRTEAVRLADLVIPKAGDTAGADQSTSTQQPQSSDAAAAKQQDEDVQLVDESPPNTSKDEAERLADALLQPDANQPTSRSRRHVDLLDPLYPVSTVAGISDSLFKMGELLIQNQLVTPVTTDYALNAYLTAMFDLSEEKRKLYEYTKLLIFDTPGMFNDFSPANIVYQLRSGPIRQSRTCHTFGPLLGFDLLRTKRCLPSGFEVQIKLYLAAESFYLLSNIPGAKFRVWIRRADLHLTKIRLVDTIASRIESSLSSRAAVFPYLEKNIRLHQILAGTQNIDKVLFQEPNIPKFLQIFFTEPEANKGSYQLNPWNFIEAAVKGISVQLNERPLIYSRGVLLTGIDLLEAYLVGIENYYGNNTNTCSVDVIGFPHGNIIHSFAISAGPLVCNLRTPPISGTLKITIDFLKPLDRPLDVYTVAYYDRKLIVTKNREFAIE